MFYVYILQSSIDMSYYVGYSQDPKARLEKHNASTSGYTSRKKPWAIVWTRNFETKWEAMREERRIKALKSRIEIERIIAYPLTFASSP